MIAWLACVRAKLWETFLSAPEATRERTET